MTARLVARVVSGGQSGADRGALEAARDAGVEHGGWCPAGGWAEDLPEPPGVLADFPGLREAPSADPDARTRLNVRDSDATLVVTSGVPSPGTDRTVALARALGRPCLVSHGEPDRVVRWLRGLPAGTGLTLNVAGPRESEQPGVGALTRALVRDVLAAGAGPVSRGEGRR